MAKAPPQIQVAETVTKHIELAKRNAISVWSKMIIEL
jgi:hypothetical protein